MFVSSKSLGYPLLSVRKLSALPLEPNGRYPSSLQPPPRLTARPAAFAEHTTDLSPIPSLGYAMLLPVVALAHAAQAIAWTALELQGRLRRANIVYVL